MSTRGAIKINKKYYYISSDAYPSFARKVINLTKRTRPRDVREFKAIANRIAGFKWIREQVPMKWVNGPFCAYKYSVTLGRGR